MLAGEMRRPPYLTALDLAGHALTFWENYMDLLPLVAEDGYITRLLPSPASPASLIVRRTF